MHLSTTCQPGDARSSERLDVCAEDRGTAFPAAAPARLRNVDFAHALEDDEALAHLTRRIGAPPCPTGARATTCR